MMPQQKMRKPSHVGAPHLGDDHVAGHLEYEVPDGEDACSTPQLSAVIMASTQDCVAIAATPSYALCSELKGCGWRQAKGAVLACAESIFCIVETQVALELQGSIRDV